jgi:hypothetical protein
METTNNNIKIVRLQSGEDIIANYYTDEESNLVLLDKPMHVIFKRLPTGKTIMMMMPWLPLELIKENNALIDLNDVLTVLEPREELVSYYIQIAVNSDVLIGDQEIGESLIGNEDEDEDDEEENLSVEELQELMKEQKKHQLH